MRIDIISIFPANYSKHHIITAKQTIMSILDYLNPLTQQNANESKQSSLRSSSFRTCHTSIPTLDESENNSSEDLSVTFSTVHIHEFGPELGDNPACNIGPPIALSKKEIRHTIVEVDDWEAHRQGRRRHDDKLKLKRKERTDRLLERYSFMEILERQKEMWRIRKSRAKSIKDFEQENDSFLKTVARILFH